MLIKLYKPVNFFLDNKILKQQIFIHWLVRFLRKKVNMTNQSNVSIKVYIYKNHAFNSQEVLLLKHTTN